LADTLTAEKAKDAPSNAETSDTVVEVGSPRVLKKSINMTSVSITARKIIITSPKKKYFGWKTPERATSIMPPANNAPTSTPRDAVIINTLNEAAFDPHPELRKFTAHKELAYA